MARTKTTVPRLARIDQRLYRFLLKETMKRYVNNKQNRKLGRARGLISRKILTRVYGEQLGNGLHQFQMGIRDLW